MFSKIKKDKSEFSAQKYIYYHYITIFEIRIWRAVCLSVLLSMEFAMGFEMMKKNYCSYEIIIMVPRTS